MSRTQPRFLELARDTYADSLGVRSREDLAASMADWTRLSPDERSFIQAHLAYLQLEAQGALHQRLVVLRDRLDRLREEVGEDLDAVMEWMEGQEGLPHDDELDGDDDSVAAFLAPEDEDPVSPAFELVQPGQAAAYRDADGALDTAGEE